VVRKNKNMANINLVTEPEKQKSKIAEGGLAIITLVFVLIMLLYAGLVFYNKTLTGKISNVKAQYESKYQEMVSGESTKTVLDFNNRITISKESLKQEKNMVEDLAQIEKSIISGVFLDSYEYDQKGNAITLNCMGDNYNKVAKQIVNFKSNEYFPNVTSGETTLDKEKGKISFKIILSLNK